MKAWEDLTSEPLTFPIGGKTYTVAPLSIDDGLLAMRILQGDEPDWDGKSAVEFYQFLMGGTWEQMRADGVSLDAATRAGVTAMTDLQSGREAAETIWEAGVDPELVAAWMAATQTSKPSTDTGSENETPSPDSTKTTTNEQPNSSALPAKRARSRGPKSSTASNSSAPTGPPSTATG